MDKPVQVECSDVGNDTTYAFNSANIHSNESSINNDLAKFLFGNMASTFQYKPNTTRTKSRRARKAQSKQNTVVPIESTVRLRSSVISMKNGSADENIDATIVKLISGISSTLPTELLIKHNMHAEIQLRAATLMGKALVCIKRKLLAIYLMKWKKIAQSISLFSAVVIARYVTKYIKKKRVASRMNGPIIEPIVVTEESREDTYVLSIDLIVLIQSMLRRLIAKKELNRRKYRMQVFRRVKYILAVGLIGKWFRQQCIIYAKRKRLEYSMARLIQSQWRCYINHTRYTKYATTNKRKHLPIYQADDESKSLYFARTGAAHTIQRFFKSRLKRPAVRTRYKIPLEFFKNIKPTVTLAEFSKGVRLIQMITRLFMYRRRLLKRKYGSRISQLVCIQRFWRRNIARVRLFFLISNAKTLAYMKRNAFKKLTKWVMRILRERHSRREVTLSRIAQETKEAGLLEFAATLRYSWADFMWTSCRQIKQLNLQSDLQKFFRTYAQGDMLDMTKAVKILKGCKGLVDKIFTAKKIDLVFTKVRAKTEKKMDYGRFLEFLFVIACSKLFKIDATNKTDDLLVIKNGEFYDEQMLYRISEKEAFTISTFRCCRFKGKSAVILVFIETYLCTNKDYIRICSSLTTRSCKDKASTLVNKSAVRIVSFISFNLKFRGWQMIKDRQRQMKLEKFLYNAAAKIQAFFRGCKGRILSKKAAQQVYFKYLDSTTQLPYWYNSRTGASFWTKPKLLRKYDCGFPIQLPEEELLFTVYCSVCETRTMQCVCDECDDVMCDNCFYKTHKTGARSHHERIKIASCVRCEFQVGSKFCRFCEDYYCDTCYTFEHKKSSFRNHLFKWMTDPCQICNERSAQWLSYVNEFTYDEQLLCLICCRENIGDPKTTDGVYKRKFLGHTVTERRKQKDADLLRQQRNAAYRAQRAIDLAAKQVLSAITIQRCYRGHISRKNNKDFVADRRNFLLRRIENAKINSTLKYMILDFFGLAPDCETDTFRERILKLYPLLDRRVVEDCINREWLSAEEFLKLRDHHVANVCRPDYFKRIYYFIKLTLFDQIILQIGYSIKRIGINMDKLRRDLRSATDRVEKQKIKKRLDTAIAIIESLLRKSESVTQWKQEADAMYQKYKGPSELFDTINERRRLGIRLPLILELKNGTNVFRVSRDSEIGSAEQRIPKLQRGDELNLNGHIFRVLRHKIIEGEEGYEVTLNRWWNSGDINLPVKRFVKKAIYILPIYIVSRTVFLSFPYQYLLCLSVRITHEMAEKLEKASHLFDEDSRGSYLSKYLSKQSNYAKAFITKYCAEPVNLNPKYGLRNLSKIAVSKGRKLVARATKYIKILRNKFKKKSLYELWKKRTDTIEVCCMLRTGIQEETLGIINISLEAPCDVLREYIRRHFRVDLNKSFGDSFVFIYSLDTGAEAELPRVKEPRTFAKKVAPYVIDPKTVLGKNVVTITADITAKPELIPVYEEEDIENNDAAPFAN